MEIPSEITDTQETNIAEDKLGIEREGEGR